jgi:hypothetical protein
MTIELNTIINQVHEGKAIHQVEVEYAIGELNKLKAQFEKINLSDDSNVYAGMLARINFDIDDLQNYDKGSYTKEEMELATKEITRQRELVRKLEDELDRSQAHLRELQVNQSKINGNKEERIRVLREEKEDLLYKLKQKNVDQENKSMISEGDNELLRRLLIENEELKQKVESQIARITELNWQTNPDQMGK